MKTVRFLSAFRTKRVNRFPGDTTLELLHAVKDRDGREWPKGCHVVPLCGGMSPEGQYQDVTVTKGAAMKPIRN